METTKEKEKSTGDFICKIKFTEFIGGKGFINFISDEATILGKYLSGLSHQDVLFKLKIYSDGTVDFTEVDTEHTSLEERKRLFEIIEEQTISTYRGRTVINELPFTSIEKVKDKTVPLYLAVEIKKPIDKLGDMTNVDLEISDDALCNLDSLFEQWSEEEEFIPDPTYTEDEYLEDEKDAILVDQSSNTPQNEKNTFLEEQFFQIKKTKIEELKDKKLKIEREISKLDYQMSSISKSLNDLRSDLKLTEDRLDSLEPIAPFNGYYFNISERQNEVVKLDPEIEKLIRDKVTKVKSINVDNFMKLFTDGEYRVRLSTKNGDNFKIIEDFKNFEQDILETFSKMQISFDSDGLFYSGELSWGEMVNSFVKFGFKQDSEFDKLCGSNSYTSSEEIKENVKSKKD